MASLTYICFVPAKGLVRDLSANTLSNIAFKVPLASKCFDETYVCKASHNYPL